MPNVFTPEFKPGDRVARPVALDNGVWIRKGDACLADSPLRRGVVTAAQLEREGDDHRFHYRVSWDDGQVGTYLAHGVHGIDRAPAQSPETDD